MTLSGICTVSKRKSCFAATSSIRRWTSGSLWPVKPMKRILPAFLAASTASIAPPSAKMRSGSSRRMTSWNCSRSMTSVCRRVSDSSSCSAAAFFGPAVDLGHQEDLLAVAVAERLAHADFAAAAVVVPAVVHEGDAVVDGGADDLDAFLLLLLSADVVAAQADHGRLLPRCAPAGDRASRRVSSPLDFSSPAESPGSAPAAKGAAAVAATIVRNSRRFMLTSLSPFTLRTRSAKNE